MRQGGREGFSGGNWARKVKSGLSTCVCVRVEFGRIGLRAPEGAGEPRFCCCSGVGGMFGVARDAETQRPNREAAGETTKQGGVRGASFTAGKTKRS